MTEQHESNGYDAITAAAEPERPSPESARKTSERPASVWLQPLLLNLVQLAALLNVSTRTAKRMTAANELPGIVRLGRCVRYDRRVIERWIKQGCPRPARRSGWRSP